MKIEFLDAFAAKLRTFGEALYVEIYVHDDYADEFECHREMLGVDELTKDDIKELSEHMGESIYKDITNGRICINPPQDYIDAEICYLVS